MRHKMKLFTDASKYGLYRAIRDFLDDNEVVVVEMGKVDYDTHYLLYEEETK